MLKTYPRLAAFMLSATLFAGAAPLADAQSQGSTAHILGDPIDIGPIDADEITIDYEWVGWTVDAAGFTGSAETLTRALFFVSLPEGLPSVFFYPELGIASIRLHDEEQAGAYFKSLGASEEIQAVARRGDGRFFVRLDGSVSWSER